MSSLYCMRYIESVVCNEGMQLCPDESACYISCDGRVDCSDGSDEQGCWQILESSAEPTSETVTGSTVSEEIYNSDTQEPSLTTTMPMTAELVFSTTVLQSVGSTVTRSISFADSVHTFESITPSFTSFSTSGSLSASTTGLTTTPGNSERFSNVFETSNATVAATVTSPLVLPTRPSEFSATISPEASSSIVRSTIVESSVETTNFISATETQPVQRSESLSESLLDLSVQISEVSSAISESTPPISSSVSISYSSVSAHRPDTSSVTPLLPSFTSVPSTNGFLPSTDVTENEATSLTPGDVVSSVFPTTASTATTADTMLTGPIILTFDIIGTAYRNVKETFEEPTFEELLQEAIAGVLNEYSNRNRRSVQNFTEDHIQVHNITFHTDNATVSVSVNSTKDGEEYVPASELETVFNNQSAMELLCQTLFGEPSTQTVAITSSTDVITSSFMSASTAQSTPSIERTAQVSSQVSSLMTSVQPSFTSFTERILPTASFASASREAISVFSGIILESIIESETITQSTPSVIPSATSDILSSMTLQSMEIRIPTESSTEISVSEPTGTISEISSEILQTDNLTTAASSSTTILSEISRSVHIVETETPQPPTTMLSDSLESSPAAMITSSDAAQTVDMEMTLTMLSSTLEPSPATVAISSEISETSSVLPTPSVSVNLSEATSQPSSSVSVQSTTSQLSSVVSKQSTTSVYMATSDSSTNIPMTSALLSAATATVEHSPTLAPSETIFTMQSRSPSSLSIQPVTDEYSQVLSDTVVEFSSESSSSLVTHSAAVQFSSSTGKAIAPTSSYSSPTPSVAHSLFSQNYTTSDTPLETETYTISVKDNATVGTLTIVTSTERNLTVEKPDIFVEEDTFQQNIGLFIFLIVAGTCIVGACLFALAGTIYRRRRRHTWDPRMAYQDAYADMEKANLSFHRDNLGIESPIPDIDILKGEPNEQETSLSKASTMTLPPTPKNEASQTDVTLDAGPSDDSRPFNQSYTSTSPRYDITTPDQAGRSGCDNRGFEEDRDSGVDGIVPVDEIDNTYPRKEFPWIEQLADTRL